MWSGRFAKRVLALAVFENFLIVMAVIGAVTLRAGLEGWLEFSGAGGFLRMWLLAAVVQFCLYCVGHYDSRSYMAPRHLFQGMAQGLAAAVLILAVLYFWVPGLMIGRGILLLTTILIVVLIGAWRLSAAWMSDRKPRERLLLVGTGPQAVRVESNGMWAVRHLAFHWP